MKEVHTGAVHIQELSHDQLKYLLEFLYCAEIPADAMAEHGHALLIAADKYDIPVLSKVCEAFISSTVCPSNVLEILELATLTSATSLKETAISVILESYEDVVFSKEYEYFAMKNPLLLVDIQKEFIKDLKKQSNTGESYVDRQVFLSHQRM
jgi:speckle-type POZ protein